jgi:integrase
MAKGQTKQAKTLTDKQIDITCAVLARSKHPEKDTVRFLLSVYAALRAKEVAAVTWSMVMDSTGGIGGELAVENTAAKGRKGGRVVYLNKPLRAALVALYEREKPSPADPIIGGTAVASRVWFHRLYDGMGFVGCSSHSGRRTAITRWARRAASQGGSLRDVQDAAGHAELASTQRYIVVNKDAKRRMVEV